MLLNRHCSPLEGPLLSLSLQSISCEGCELVDELLPAVNVGFEGNCSHICPILRQILNHLGKLLRDTINDNEDPYTSLNNPRQVTYIRNLRRLALLPRSFHTD